MKRRAAVFTIVQNEPHFLPKWLAYYAQHFNGADIFVLDHNSTDNSIADAAGQAVFVPVHRSMSFDHSWLRDTVQDFQRFLLDSYACVVFTEVDELIVSDIGLSETINFFSNAWDWAAKCVGVEIVDRHDTPSYEKSHYYNKTLISRTPTEWSVGFHEAKNQPDYCWPGLYLIHTHRQNYAIAREKHRETAKRKWSKADIDSGAGAHNRIESDVDFNKWFYRQDGPAIQLPESILRQL